MNILIVALDFKPNIGGIAEYTHQIARNLHSAGDNVTVLAQRRIGDREFDLGCPYRVHRHDFEALRSASLIRRYIDSYGWIKSHAKDQPAEIIISNALGAKVLISWLVAKTLHLPYSIFTHGLEINMEVGLRGKLARRLSLRGADKVFCNSSFTQSLVMKHGVLRNRTLIIPGGVSIKDFKAGTDKSRSPITAEFGLENKKVIFTLGRLVERKGNDMVIKALPKLLQEIPDAMYLIGGDGPYEGKLRTLAQENGVENHVIFAGRLSDSERQAFYNASDVFVMPCRELENGDVEGFGIVFSEANACGKPIIVGKSGGAIDAVKNNETGLLVNPLDIDQIADAIIYLLRHPDIAKQMGRNGRQRVERELTWEKIIPRMRSELKSLILKRYKRYK